MKERLDIFVDASSRAQNSKLSGIGLVATENRTIIELNTFIKPFETTKMDRLESMGIEQAIRCAIKHLGEYKLFVIHNDNSGSVSKWKTVLTGKSRTSDTGILKYLSDQHLIHQARILFETGTLRIQHSGRQSSAQSRLADRMASDAYVSPKAKNSTQDAFAYITKHCGTKKKIKGYDQILDQVSKAAAIARNRMSERVIAAKHNIAPAVVYHPGFFADAAFDKQLASYFN